MNLLDGIKVIELGQWMAVPAAAAILGDWGADVVKIENLSGGDPLRGYVETRPDYPKTDVNGPFELDNRNKRSVAINLRYDLGQQIAHRLVAGADIFLTNLRSKALDSRRMDYDSLSSTNPNLIYVKLTGYGENGPDADQPGFDRSAYYARSGIQDILRSPEDPPLCMRPAFGDHMASGFLVAATLGALWHRERNNIAQQVNLSLYHCGVWQLGTDIQVSLLSSKDIPQASRNTPGNALTNHYKTKDGKWIVLAMPQSQKYWPKFCKALGRDDLEFDQRYTTHQARAENAASLVTILDDTFATKTYTEWKALLDDYGCVFGLIQATSEVVSDPQAWANAIFTPIEHPTAGNINLIATPGNFSKTPSKVRTAAPEVGQHTEEVLLEIGYNWDEIIQLKEEHIIN